MPIFSFNIGVVEVTADNLEEAKRLALEDIADCGMLDDYEEEADDGDEENEDEETSEEENADV